MPLRHNEKAGITDPEYFRAGRGTTVAKKNGKGDKQAKKTKKRYEVSLSVAIAVKAKSEHEAAMAATQWLVNTLIAADKPNSLSVYPPTFCKDSGSMEETTASIEGGEEPPSTGKNGKNRIVAESYSDIDGP